MKAESYWDARYKNGGNSGYGSYDEQLTKKLQWLAPLDFESVTEVGCGDFNFGKNLLELHPASYTGIDISNVIVKRNQKLYPQHTFIHKESTTTIPSADLLLCVDVLFHVLDDSEAEELLSDLKLAWTKYLVITAYERNEPKDNHVRIRKFNYKQFGKPLIREVVEHDGEMYFYVFKHD